MKLKLVSLFVIIALAVPPISPGSAPAWAGSDRHEQVAVRIAQLSPSTLEYLREGQTSPVIPVRRGGGAVAGLIIGAVIGAAIARNATRKKYKRRYGKRKYRRYW